jgi:hypothetical protein
MTAPPITHDIELVCPLYGSKGTHTAFCTCGWASPELPSAGQATIAGYTHIREAKPKESAT